MNTIDVGLMTEGEIDAVMASVDANATEDLEVSSAAGAAAGGAAGSLGGAAAGYVNR